MVAHLPVTEKVAGSTPVTLAFEGCSGRSGEFRPTPTFIVNVRLTPLS